MRGEVVDSVRAQFAECAFDARPVSEVGYPHMAGIETTHVGCAPQPANGIALVLEVEGREEMIYKHAIASIRSESLPSGS